MWVKDNNSEGLLHKKTQKKKKLREIYQKVHMLQGRLLLSFLKAGTHHKFLIGGGDTHESTVAFS